MNRIKAGVAGVVVAVVVGGAIASFSAAQMNGDAAMTYDFKDPKGVNGIVFVMDSQIEPIVGMANGVGGELSYDPADPKATRGTLTLDAQSLQTSNPTMTEHLHGAEWLNVQAHPTITYTIEKVTKVAEHQDGSHALAVDGTLSLTGVKLAKSIEIHATPVPGAAERRGGGKHGDLLVLRTTFDVSRKDFQIKPDLTAEKVGPSIKIIAHITGYQK